MKGFDLRPEDLQGGRIEPEAIARLALQMDVNAVVIDAGHFPHWDELLARRNLLHDTKRVERITAIQQHLSRLNATIPDEITQKIATTTDDRCFRLGKTIKVDAHDGVLDKYMQDPQITNSVLFGELAKLENDEKINYVTRPYAAFIVRTPHTPQKDWGDLTGLPASQIIRYPQENVFGAFIDAHELTHIIQTGPTRFDLRWQYKEEIGADLNARASLRRAKIGEETIRAITLARHLGSLRKTTDLGAHWTAAAIDALDAGTQFPSLLDMHRAISQITKNVRRITRERNVKSSFAHILGVPSSVGFLGYSRSAQNWFGVSPKTDPQSYFSALAYLTTAGQLTTPLAQHIAEQALAAARYFCGDEITEMPTRTTTPIFSTVIHPSR